MAKSQFQGKITLGKEREIQEGEVAVDVRGDNGGFQIIRSYSEHE